MRGRRAGGMVAILLFCGLVAGACSGSGSPSGDGHDHVVAAYVVVDANVSTSQLTADARELSTRLRTFGDAGRLRRRQTTFGRRVGDEPPPRPGIRATRHRRFPAASRPVPGGPVHSAGAGDHRGDCADGGSSSRYSLQAPNLTVDTVTGSSNASAIPPDPALSSYPSTSATDNDAHPDSTVLVPAVGEGGARYLLGPTAVDDPAVASTRVTFQPEEWVVDVTLTGPGATAWDMLAGGSFTS